MHELGVKLSSQWALLSVKHCPNLRKLVLNGSTKLSQLIQLPCLATIESLKLELQFENDHEVVQLGLARRRLRMPKLKSLEVQSPLMPRFLNALVEDTPKLEHFSLRVVRLAQEDAGAVALLSNRLVNCLTHYFVGDGYYSTAPCLCIEEFCRRRDERGAPIFQPKKVTLDQANSRDVDIVFAVLRNVHTIYVDDLCSSRLSLNLPEGLRTLEIGYLEKDNGQQRDDLEKAYEKFVTTQGGKIVVHSVLEQYRTDGLDDDNWLSELDFWESRLGREVPVVEPPMC